MTRRTDRVPSLRVILDHLPQLDLSTADLREIGKRPQVFVKVSGVLRRVSAHVRFDTNFYRDRLDEIWDIFGPDRLIYGSDWPNSDSLGTYAQVLKIVQEYFNARGRAAAERYFWKNSITAYGWIKRAPEQPGPSRPATPGAGPRAVLVACQYNPSFVLPPGLLFYLSRCRTLQFRSTLSEKREEYDIASKQYPSSNCRGACRGCSGHRHVVCVDLAAPSLKPTIRRDHGGGGDDAARYDGCLVFVRRHRQHFFGRRCPARGRGACRRDFRRTVRPPH